MRRFWLRPLSLLQPLADRPFPPASPCACDASSDPHEPCGACHATEREFPGAETRRGPPPPVPPPRRPPRRAVLSPSRPPSPLTPDPTLVPSLTSPGIPVIFAPLRVLVAPLRDL